MADVKWKPSGRVTNPLTILSTELNSLAAGAGSAPSGTIPNDTGNIDEDLYVDLELVVTFGTAPTDGTTVSVYLVRQIDGTNFEDASATGPIVPRNGFVGNFVVRSVTTAQRMVLPGVVIAPRDMRFMVQNNTNQAFPATNSTLKGFFYKEQVS